MISQDRDELGGMPSREQSRSTDSTIHWLLLHRFALASANSWSRFTYFAGGGSTACGSNFFRSGTEEIVPSFGT